MAPRQRGKRTLNVFFVLCGAFMCLLSLWALIAPPTNLNEFLFSQDFSTTVNDLQHRFDGRHQKKEERRVVSLIEAYNSNVQTAQPIYKHNHSGINHTYIQPKCVSKAMAAGVFFQTRHHLESLVKATHQKVGWSIGPFANSHAHLCSWNGTELWDLSRVVPFFNDTWVDPSTVNTSALRVQSAGCAINCFSPTLRNKAAWETVLVALRPAPWIVDLIEAITPKEPFVCLHPRVESDFHRVFKNSSNYRTWPQIHTALQTYFRSPSWKELSNNESVRTLFVAGNVSANLVRQLILEDRFFDTMHSKAAVLDTLPVDVAAKARLGAPSTLIDSYVCQRSVLHIGTRSSIWDEWVYGVRRLHIPPLPSLQYAGHVGPHLLPFKGANDGRFFLTEKERAQYLHETHVPLNG